MVQNSHCWYCLRYVFGPRYAAVNAIYDQFRADCLTQLFMFFSLF